MFDEIIAGLMESAECAKRVSALTKESVRAMSDDELRKAASDARSIVPEWVTGWVADDMYSEDIEPLCGVITKEIDRRQHKRYVAEMRKEYGPHWKRILEKQERDARNELMTRVHGPDWESNLDKIDSLPELFHFEMEAVTHAMNENASLFDCLERTDEKTT